MTHSVKFIFNLVFDLLKVKHELDNTEMQVKNIKKQLIGMYIPSYSVRLSNSSNMRNQL